MNRIKVVYKDGTTNVIVSSEQYVKSNNNIKEYLIKSAAAYLIRRFSYKTSTRKQTPQSSAPGSDGTL